MKKFKLFLFLALCFLLCGRVNAASVAQSDFFVGDKYIVAGDLCESSDDTVKVTKDGGNCVIEFVKAGSYSVNLTLPTATPEGATPGLTISSNIYDAKYKVTLQQLVDVINNKDSIYATTFKNMMLAKDYKPAAAKDYTFSASLSQDGILYRFGYDTDIVETNIRVQGNLLQFSYAQSSNGTTPAPATEYTSTRYTVGLTSLFFFMSEAALDGDKVLEIFMDDEKYDLIDEEINDIKDKYILTDSNVIDSENYRFDLRLMLNGKFNADVIELYNSKAQFPDSGANGAEPAPEEEIVNPETGLFVSIMIIAFMGLVSMIIMKINRNRIYRI